MFLRKTLLVLGAGASMEVNLPSGKELTRRIAKLLNMQFEFVRTQKSGDQLIWNACEAHARSSESASSELYFNACRRIADAMPQAASIDNFIDAHSGEPYIELCGKLAIVRSILEAEERSRLYVDARNGPAQPNYDALEDTWLNRFWSLLAQGSLERFRERLAKFALVVFNYDRCIEQFLYFAIQNYYFVKPEQAAEILNDLAIYHPYGKVGSLPWQKASARSIGFGQQVNVNKLLELSQEIRTYTEEADPQLGNIEEVHQAILEARVIVFLGFAFHPSNMRLLTPPRTQQREMKNSSLECYATAFQASSSNRKVIEGLLKALRPGLRGRNQYNVTDRACVGLFDEYWKSLEIS